MEESISVETLNQKLQNKDFLLVDIRGLDKPTIPNTDYQIPLQQIKSLTEKEPDTTKEIILYCNTGNSSKLGIQILKNKGYTDVKDLDGGYDEWERKHNSNDGI